MLYNRRLHLGLVLLQDDVARKLGLRGLGEPVDHHLQGVRAMEQAATLTCMVRSPSSLRGSLSEVAAMKHILTWGGEMRQ